MIPNQDLFAHIVIGVGLMSLGLGFLHAARALMNLIMTRNEDPDA